MEARAQAKYVRISPRKARQVIDLIRGKDIGEAIAILRNTPKKASRLIEKVLNSAVANAENNYEMSADELYIKEAYVDEGPTMKRYRARAQGQASMIRKRTSHITIKVSDEKKEG
ncbi:MAG: large subunit ribosomal protein [Halanaerobiales bacterium]|nr:large subunit ribosomal protein [Halanaerobiales bacterium]